MKAILMAQEAAKLARDYPELTIQEVLEIAADICKDSKYDEN
jgi:hypothetical protein